MSEVRQIVLVDDDDDYAAAVTAFLELHEYVVHRAKDGREGLALAKRVKPDLVLMDVMMEERTDGFFAVQNLRRTPGLEDVPVFMVSSVYAAAPEFQVRPDRGWMAHDEFFTKPVDLPALLHSIVSRIGGDGVGGPAPNPETTK